MSKYLPERIFPCRMVRSRERLRGRLPLSSMRRLAESLSRGGGDVQIDIEFMTDEAGTPCAVGAIRAGLWLTCQRCLEPVEVAVQPHVSLAIVEPGQVLDFDDRYDPLEAGEGPASLVEIVEDELILALPIVPMHEPTVCSVAERYRARPQTPASERGNPFAVLSGLKPRS